MNRGKSSVTELSLDGILLPANNLGQGLDPQTVMRSTMTTPLVDQVEQLQVEMNLLICELKMEADARPTGGIVSYLETKGLLSRNGYVRHADTHPANRAALLRVGRSILEHQGISMIDAMTRFVVAKKTMLMALEQRLGGAVVYIPSNIRTLDEGVLPDAKDKTKFLATAGLCPSRLRDFISGSLNIIRLPMRSPSGGGFQLVLIPNIPGASNKEMSCQVKTNI